MSSHQGPAPGFRNHPGHTIEIAPAASRWQASVGDIAWTYPETYEEVSDIAGFIAFYANKVSVIEVP